MHKQNTIAAGMLWLASSVAAAGDAGAPVTPVHITPMGVAYTATGKVSFSKSIIHADCIIDVAGRVNADGRHVSIDKVVFHGESCKCARVAAMGLPWRLTPTSETTGSMSGIRVSVRAPLVGGTCSPDPVTVSGSWSNELNQMQATNAPVGSCTIKTLLIQPTPAFHVSP